MGVSPEDVDRMAALGILSREAEPFGATDETRVRLLQALALDRGAAALLGWRTRRGGGGTVGRGAVVRALLLVGVLVVSFVPEVPALAHGSGVILVPRTLDSRPRPILDASCESDYRRSSNARTIQYRPGYAFSPATVSLLASPTDLYVCVQGLSRRPNGSTTDPYLSLVFDADHDGGAAPDADDVNLAIDEDGDLTEYHGNGVGFVPIAGRGDWRAVTNRSQEVTWNAEYRIGLSMIGGGRPGTVTGFQARHTSLVVHNDTFAWPTDSQNRQPRTWGDLFFLGAATEVPGTVRLDVGRVTQGLEWDIADGANTPYDFIRGKDALVSARLYSLGSVAELVFTACRVQRVSPVVDDARTLPADATTRPRIFTTPAGISTGMGDVRCWVPGSFVSDPGVYRFSVIVQMAGGERQTIEVDDRVTRPARAVRLMIYRWIFPTGHPENRMWDATLNASAIDAMFDLQRVMPVPAGVGGFSFGATAPAGAPGLRYFFSPTVYQCVAGDGETVDRAASRCDATTRNNGDLQRMTYDRQAAERDAVDGQHRDRIDLQEVYVSTPESGGGQSCWSNSSSAGSGLDSLATGQSHYVPIQETEHCWFQVRPESPHSKPDDRSHSRNAFFTAGGGWPLANTHARQEIATPRSVLFPNFFAGARPDRSETFTNEGYEFNDLRRTLLSLPPPSGLGTRRAAAGGATQLQIAFLMDRTGEAVEVLPQVSRRLDDSPLEPTTPDPNSDFALVFRDGEGAETGRLPFAVTEVGTHEPVPIEGQVLVADIPPESVEARIEHDDVSLLTQPFSAAAPEVTDVAAVSGDAPGTLDVTWQASDADSSSLTYSVFFQQHPDSLRTLVETGLTEESYAFDTRFAPGTTDGVITVEASDGYNTGEASTSPVAVADKRPDVAISSPREGARLAAGQPVRLLGSAYDANRMAPVAGKDLSWASSVDGELGNGQSLTVEKLSTGKHTLTLTAVTPEGTQRSASVHVTVLPDGDGDGIPNAVESQVACLNPKGNDSAADPDKDVLSSFREWQRGTNPCKPDSDVDGWSDGDEQLLGSDPRNGKDVPDPGRVFLDTEALDLGSCPSPEVAHAAVEAASKTTPWSVAVDVPYVHAKGDGVGPGRVTIEADCDGLVKGQRYRGTVGVQARGGQLRLIEVRFRT